MNAYELAKAQQAYLAPTLEEIIKQQADRIAELEKDGKVCATCGGLVYDPVIKQTKQTPDGLIDPKSYYIGYADGKKAPQTKPLSDEEILFTENEVNVLKNAIENYVYTLKAELTEEQRKFKGYERCSDIKAIVNELKDAERALEILKKASEK